MNEKTYGLCKACGSIVYRMPDSDDWLYWRDYGPLNESDKHILDSAGVPVASLPSVHCGCND